MKGLTMTTKVVEGKPYAGNPHVRFDEGEVAPAATPRRGSLLCRMEKVLEIGYSFKGLLAAVIVLAAGASAFASELVWKDGVSGKMSDDACWEGEKAPATSSTKADLQLVNTTGDMATVVNDLPGSTYNGDVFVHNGSWTFTGAFPRNSNALLVGKADQTTTIVNYSNWDMNYYLQLGREAGSKTTFMHKSGNLAMHGQNSWNLMIGWVKNSDTTFVFEGGTMTCGVNGEGTIAHEDGSVARFTQKGGTVTLDYAIDKRLLVGGHGTGYLNIEDGSFVVKPGAYIEVASGRGQGYITLSGGTLAAECIDHGNGPSSSFTINGGTWLINGRASKGFAIDSNANLAFQIGAKGGVIELADGVDAVIPANIGELAGSTGGGLLVKGAGTLTFNGAVSYTGATSVEAGTTIIVNNSTSKANILANGFRVVGAPKIDTPYTVAVFSDDLAEGDLANVTCDIAAEFTKSIGSDGKSIVVTCTAIKPGWYVGPANGDLGEAANWSDGKVPTSGDAVIGSFVPATLASSGVFAPESITFPADSAKITINGSAAISGLRAITVEGSDVHHVFNCPVSFADKVEADLTVSAGAYPVFAGGMTAYALRKTGADANLGGNVTLTKEDVDWNRNGNVDLILLPTGTHLTIPSMRNNGAANFYVGGGSTLTVNSGVAFSGNATKHIVYRNNGTVEINGLVDASGLCSLLFATETAAAGTGVVKAHGLVSSGENNNNYRFVPNPGGSGDMRWVIGERGISGIGQYYVQAGRTVTLAPSSDFEVNSELLGNPNAAWKIATTDANDGVTARQITVNKAISAGTVSVGGAGSVVFNVAGGTNKGLTANDAAKIVVNAGQQPCNGAVTMNGTSTLKVAQSGVVTLGGKLACAAGTTLAFNFTERTVAPTLAVPSTGSLELPEEGTVKIRLTDECDGVSSARKHVLLSGAGLATEDIDKFELVDAPKWVEGILIVDGDLVLQAKKNCGLIILFK